MTFGYVYFPIFAFLSKHPIIIQAFAFSVIATPPTASQSFCITQSKQYGFFFFLWLFCASGKRRQWRRSRSRAEDERPNLSSRRHHTETLISALHGQRLIPQVQPCCCLCVCVHEGPESSPVLLDQRHSCLKLCTQIKFVHGAQLIKGTHLLIAFFHVVYFTTSCNVISILLLRSVYMTAIHWIDWFIVLKEKQ